MTALAVAAVLVAALVCGTQLVLRRMSYAHREGLNDEATREALSRAEEAIRETVATRDVLRSLKAEVDSLKARDAFKGM